MDPGQLHDPRVRAPRRVDRGALRHARGASAQARQAQLAGGALRRAAGDRLRGLRLGSVGARRAPRRDARLLQRHQRVPASARPAGPGLPGADRAARRRRVRRLARGHHAARSRCAPPRFRTLPRRRLRRTGRSPGRDGALHAGELRGRRRAPRDRDHRPARHRHRPAVPRPGAHLRRAGAPVRAAHAPRSGRSLPVPGDGGRRRLRRTRAPLQHGAAVLAQRPAVARPARRARGLPDLSRPGQPRVLPHLARQAHQAGGVRAPRPAAGELHAAAVDLRGLHLVLRRPDAGALGCDRPRRLFRDTGQGDLGRDARPRTPAAKRGRVELRRLDQVLPPGRELAQRDRQLLRQGIAGGAGARSHHPRAQRRRALARRRDAVTVAALRQRLLRAARGSRRGRVSAPARAGGRAATRRADQALGLRHRRLAARAAAEGTGRAARVRPRRPGTELARREAGHARRPADDRDRVHRTGRAARRAVGRRHAGGDRRAARRRARAQDAARAPPTRRAAARARVPARRVARMRARAGCAAGGGSVADARTAPRRTRDAAARAVARRR